MKGEFYKMSYEDWDQGTNDLSPEEESAYLRLCHQMYRVRGPVKNNPTVLRGTLRQSTQKTKRLIESLTEKGKLVLTTDGELSNNRAITELFQRGIIEETKAKAGRKGGLKRQKCPENMELR